MKNLQEYIEEGLLDDFDDLEKESDIIVNRNGTIGEKYEVRTIESWNALNSINKSNLKNYPCYWDHTYGGMRIEHVSKKPGINIESPTPDIVTMLNTLLSFKINDLELGEYREKSTLFKFFKDLFNIDELNGRVNNHRGKTEIELSMSIGKSELYIWLTRK